VTVVTVGNGFGDRGQKGRIGWTNRLDIKVNGSDRLDSDKTQVRLVRVEGLQLSTLIAPYLLVWGHSAVHLISQNGGFIILLLD